MLKVSLVIATYNRCKDLENTLESLLKQEGDGRIICEVLVIDNNSTDQTKEVVCAYQKKVAEFNPGRILMEFQYLFEPIQGKTYAVNKGIKAAKGNIIAFTDDDAVLDPAWLLSIIQCFENYKCDGVGGRIIPIYPERTPQWIKDNQDLISGPIVMYDHGEECKKYQKPMLEFFGANFAFKREVFNENGLFRTDIGPGAGTYGDDTEFISRLVTKGRSLYYCGKAVVRHPVDRKRMNLRYIAQWSFKLGRYRVIIDDHSMISNQLVFYFGIPRYLIREIVSDSASLLMKIFNKREFLKVWKKLFTNLGRVYEIRRIN